MKHKCHISIGSNLGDRLTNCKCAIEELKKWSSIISVSSFYETEPWGYKDDNNYINMVIKISTSLSPHDLLNKLKIIEVSMGRKKKQKNVLYQARIIDLDILFFDNLIINQTNLIIPHPKLSERKYVLQPFVEIDPHFICPLTNNQMIEIFQKSQDPSRVCLYTH